MRHSNLALRLRQSRRARVEMRLRAGAIGGALTLGAALVPHAAQAALVTVNGPSAGVNLDAGEAIHITPSGSITDAGDDGVENGPGNATLGDGINTGILNEGAIDAGDNGVLLSTNTTLQGSIVNRGTIAAGSDGIQLDETSEVTGDISNEGSIGSAGTPVGDVGISVFSNSSVGGNIANSGDIHSTNDGIEVTDGSEISGAIRNETGGTIDAGQDGIELSGATVQQGIINAGSITAAEDGILIDNAATLNGGIDSSGTISAQGGDGIRIDQASTVSGGISNSGSITASGGTVGEPSDGIEVSGISTTVTGNIVNSGSINAETDGIDISQSARIQGDVSNALGGVITAGESGIEIDAAATVTGDVVNAGGINGDDGVLINRSQVQGGVSNTGTINAASDGISIYGTGSEVQQGVSNTGTINALDSVGIYIDTAATIGQGITNSGAINADFGIYISQGATVNGAVTNAVGGTIESSDEGATVRNATVTGGIRNDGTINAANEGILVSSAASIQQGVTNTGTIDAFWGLWVSESEVSGGITNEAGGLIDSDDVGVGVYSATVAGGITNAGTIRAADQGSYGNDGIRVYYSSTVTGDITNAAGGLIDAATNGGDAGISVDSTSAVDGAIVNAGTIDAGDDDAIVVTSNSSVSGGVSNSGSLTGGLALSGTDGAGGGIDVLNTGVIDIGTRGSSISGGFTQTSTGELAITLLNPFGAGVAALRIGADVLLDGLLSLTFDSAFSVADGQRFTLLGVGVGGTLGGMFSNYGDDALVSSFGNVGLYLDYADGGDVELYGSAAAAPLPGTLALFGLGALGMVGAGAARRRKRD